MRWTNYFYLAKWRIALPACVTVARNCNSIGPWQNDVDLHVAHHATKERGWILAKQSVLVIGIWASILCTEYYTTELVGIDDNSRIDRCFRSMYQRLQRFSRYAEAKIRQGDNEQFQAVTTKILWPLTYHKSKSRRLGALLDACISTSILLQSSRLSCHSHQPEQTPEIHGC